MAEVEQEEFVGEVRRQWLGLGYELVEGGFERTIPEAVDIFSLYGDIWLLIWRHRESVKNTVGRRNKSCDERNKIKAGKIEQIILLQHVVQF